MQQTELPISQLAVRYRAGEGRRTIPLRENDRAGAFTRTYVGEDQALEQLLEGP